MFENKLGDMNKRYSSAAFFWRLNYLRGDYLVRYYERKAICDSLYKWRVVGSIKELKAVIDKELIKMNFHCDFKLMIRLANIQKN